MIINRSKQTKEMNGPWKAAGQPSCWHSLKLQCFPRSANSTIAKEIKDSQINCGGQRQEGAKNEKEVHKFIALIEEETHHFLSKTESNT
jgi:hypothetical protein